MTKIFLSYRREDTSGHAGRLSDRLRALRPQDQVFMDVDNIRPGVDFVRVIEDAVGSCDVLIALIGDEWLTMSDGRGNRKLDRPEDFVRIEIAAALTRGVLVVPVLVANAQMPAPEDLPPELARLARIHALDLSDKRWEYDVGILVKTIEDTQSSGQPLLPAEPARPTHAAPVPTPVADPPPIENAPASDVREGSDGVWRRSWSPRIVIPAVAVVLLLVIGGALFLASDPPKTSITAAAVSPPAVDAAGQQVTYEPENAIDGDPTTAWRMDGDGRGARVSLDFGREVSIRRVGLLPGYAKIDPYSQADRFAQNRRITQVRYHFDDGAAIEQAFLDTPVVQFIDMHVDARRMTIEILETIPGDRNFDYTAISEIAVDMSEKE